MAPVTTAQPDRELLRSLARRLEPGDAGAHNNLGVLYFNKGLHEEAAAMFARALELQPRLEVARRNLEIVYTTPAFAEAHLAGLRAAAAAEPPDRAARLALGRALALCGRHDEAVAELTALLARDGADLDVLAELAASVRAGGDLVEAQRWLEQALALAPDRGALHRRLGEVLYHRGMSEPARERLERAVALDPDDADALHLLGFVLGDLGHGAAANAAAARARSLNPTLARAEANLSLERPLPARPRSPRTSGVARRPRPAPRTEGSHLAHFNLGLAFRAKGYLGEAAREYELALERAEEPALVTQALAEVRLLQRDYAAALALYERLLQATDSSPKLWNERGVALHLSGRLDEARASYERALAHEARYALARNNLAVVRSHLRDPEGARAALEEALQAEPRLSKAALNLALLHRRAGRLDAARDAYREVLALEPEHPVAWNGIGLVLAEHGQHADARAAFARAIQARPDFAEAHYNLGFALSSLGEFDAALRATRRALELDPMYGGQRFELAIDLEFEAPDLSVLPDLTAEEPTDGAVDAFDFDAAALDALVAGLAPGAAPPDAPAPGAPASPAAPAHPAPPPEGDAAVLAEAGAAFAAQGLHGEALERYAAACALAPGLRDAVLGLARALVALGRGAEARPVLVDHLAAAPEDADVLALLADAAVAAGEVHEALALAERAARLAPRRPDLHHRLGDVRSLAGDAASAADAYRIAILLEPARATARHALAEALLATGHVGDAEAQLVAALETLPGYAGAARRLAALRREGGRADAAVPPLVALLHRDPYDLDALVELGETLLVLDRPRDAEVAVGRALRFDPEHAAALYLRGVLLAQQHQLREALACWHHAMAVDVHGGVAERARRSALDAGRYLALARVA